MGLVETKQGLLRLVHFWNSYWRPGGVCGVSTTGPHVFSIQFAHFVTYMMEKKMTTLLPA